MGLKGLVEPPPDKNKMIADRGAGKSAKRRKRAIAAVSRINLQTASENLNVCCMPDEPQAGN
jgi:hypothetical protein